MTTYFRRLMASFGVRPWAGRCEHLSARQVMDFISVYMIVAILIFIVAAFFLPFWANATMFVLGVVVNHRASRAHDLATYEYVKERNRAAMDK